MTASTDKPSNQSNLMARAFCLSLEISRPGNRRKVPTGAVEKWREGAQESTEDNPQTGPSAEMVSISKKLIECKEFQSVQGHDNETRRWLYAHSLPGPFRAGTYLIPVKMVKMVDDYLVKRLAERQDLIMAYADVYPAKAMEAQKKLGALANPLDYPSVQLAIAAFQISWRYVSFGTPEELSTISKELFAREKDKAAEQFKTVAQEGMDALRVGFAKLVGRMSERLSEPDKKFKDTLVSNLAEFMETFPLLNINDDDELAKHVKTVHALLEDVKPDDLRHYKDVRTTVAAGIAKVEKQLEPLIVNRPRRALILEQEEVA